MKKVKRSLLLGFWESSGRDKKESLGFFGGDGETIVYDTL